MDRGLRIRLACSLSERLLGLLRKGVCVNGEVLLLFPCRSIHTFGLQEAIDVAFIDRQGQVLEAIRALSPKRLLSCRRAVGTLERRAAQDTPWFVPGDTVALTAEVSEQGYVIKGAMEGIR
jgi:uncharacterized membrane protein (UPF0127 family)